MVRFRGCYQIHTLAVVDPVLFHAGSIQAGINLDFGNSSFYAGLAIKPGTIRSAMNSWLTFEEGANGQMPNLDLINISVLLAESEGVRVTLHGNDISVGVFPNHINYVVCLKSMLHMMKNQAFGEPTGAHGVFLKYKPRDIVPSDFHVDIAST